jgi:hypothetical protein
MMLYVALGVPEHFVPKAQYAIRVLLAPFNVDIIWSDVGDVSLHGGIYYGVFPYPDLLGERPVLCIESLPQTWEYFDSRNRYNPSDTVYNGFGLSTPVPILFGSHGVDQRQVGITMIHADLVASAFFWLSDWQDSTRSEKDSHGRQPFHGSMQQFLQLHHRAVVDEYSDLLARFLEPLGTLTNKKKQWQTIYSHDIDRIQKKTAGIVVRESLDYLLLNKLNQGFRERINRWGKSMAQFVRGADAYEASIIRILNEHASRDIQGCFLFKSIIHRHIHDANDYLGYPFFDVVMAMVRELNIEIGFHSGYEAGGNPDLMRSEYGKLCNRVGQHIDVHRSHYLRYNEGITFPMLEQLGVKVDSSVAWADHTGFRAQTCRPYPLFDISSNKELGVLEIPLSVMDTQSFGYMKLDAEDAIDDSITLVNTVKRHAGVMVWNFHHHIYDDVDAPGWYQLLDTAFDMGMSSQITTFKKIYEENAYNYV